MNIFVNFWRGLTQQQCIDELNSIFGDEAPSRTTVYRWYGEFKRGRSSLQNEFCEGQPKSVIVLENIDAVSQLMLQDHHVTYRETEITLGISGTSIHQILYEHLTVKKFYGVGSHTICQSLKKRLVSIGLKKCSKNRIAVLRNTSMTSWQVMNRGFTRMSSSTAVDCMGVFKCLQAKDSLFFHTCHKRTSRATQNSQFCVVHNHLFASCLPRNQENQPLKTDHPSPR